MRTHGVRTSVAWTLLLALPLFLVVLATLIVSGSWESEPELSPLREIPDPDTFAPPVTRPAPRPPARLTDAQEQVLRRLRDLLRKTTGKRRRGVLDRCIELGPEAATLVPDLRALVSETSGREALHAMTAIMVIEDSHAYFDVVLDSKHPNLLRKLIPGSPRALNEALHWWKLRPELAGLRESSASLAMGDADATKEILARVEWAEVEALHPWIRVALHLDPVPEDLGPLIANRLRRDGDVCGGHVSCALHAKGIDFGPIREEVLPALLERIPVAPHPELGHLLPAIVNLAAPDSKVTRPILALLDRNGYPAERAMVALFRLGPNARDAVPDLINRAERNAPQYRGRYVGILGNIAAVEAVPALRRWMRHAPVDVRVKIVGAVIRCDRELETTESVEVILAGLRDSRPRVRKAAARSLKRVDKVPPVLAEALRDLSGR